MVKPAIRLSTAIRKGIEHFPVQAKEAFFRRGREGQGACALGCAIYAVYGTTGDEMIDELVDAYPELWQEEHHIQPDGMSKAKIDTETLKDVIVTLNDDHGWSREQIADWLESEGL